MSDTARSHTKACLEHRNLHRDHEKDCLCTEPAPSAGVKKDEWPMCKADADRMERAAEAIESLNAECNRFATALIEARARIAALEAGIPQFDPVVLSMLYSAADEVPPTHRGAVLRAYEYIRALLPAKEQGEAG